MTENDYNAMKPVPALPNVTGVNPAGGSGGQTKKRHTRKRSQRKTNFGEDRLTENRESGFSMNDTGEHRIDYCA